MKAKTKSCKLLNTFNCIKKLPVLVGVYAIMIIGVINNKNGAISICFFEF